MDLLEINEPNAADPRSLGDLTWLLAHHGGSRESTRPSDSRAARRTLLFSRS
jgi:hypothetical protein